MLSSSGLISIIFRRSCTEWEGCLPFSAYGVTIWRTILELDALGVCDEEIASKRICENKTFFGFE